MLKNLAGSIAILGLSWALNRPMFKQYALRRQAWAVFGTRTTAEPIRFALPAPTSFGLERALTTAGHGQMSSKGP